MSSIITLTNREEDFADRPRAVIITGPGFQDQDCIYMGYRLREAHFRVDFATAGGKPVLGRCGTSVPLDRRKPDCIRFDELVVDDYDLVMLPGGYEAPDRVRQSPDVKRFVKDAFEAGKVVAALCHGPWIAASAGILAGRHVAAYPGLLDDVVHAGAIVVDGADVVVDEHLVTGSYYGEAGLFMQATIALTEARLGIAETGS